MAAYSDALDQKRAFTEPQRLFAFDLLVASMFKPLSAFFAFFSASGRR